VVVEAPIKSGALITAKYALELGRDVYAVPADALKESARGSNNLLADGAIPLVSPDALFSLFSPNTPALSVKRKEYAPQNENETAVLKTLERGPLHLDDIIYAAKLPTNVVQETIIALELNDAVVSFGGMRYGICSPDERL
jgi:DNA processing protein